MTMATICSKRRGSQRNKGVIEYDPVKDAENIAKHGFALIGATRLFEGPFIEEEDDRFGYEETRFVAIGPVSR